MLMFMLVPEEVQLQGVYKGYRGCALVSVLRFCQPGDCYWAWCHLFNSVCQRHAPYRKVKIRRNSLPWITL